MLMVKATTSVVPVRAVLSLLHARARRERDSGRLAAAAGAL